MNTRPIVTTVILILIFLPWSVAAQQSVGVRAGVSADPDQFLFGGHLETGPLLERLVFRPNAEIGVGDDLIVIGLNFEFAFKIALDDQAWTPYLGAGPAVNIIDRSDSGRGRGNDDTSVEGGFNILIGPSMTGGFSPNSRSGPLTVPTSSSSSGMRSDDGRESC